METKEVKAPEYKLAEPHPRGLIYWCQSHRRRATHVRVGICEFDHTHCCDPETGGICLPCHVTMVTPSWYAENKRPLDPRFDKVEG